MIELPRVFYAMTVDEQQCAMALAAQIRRMGGDSFRDLHGWTDPNQVLLDVVELRGFTVIDLLDDDHRRGNQIPELADWILAGDRRRERG